MIKYLPRATIGSELHWMDRETNERYPFINDIGLKSKIFMVNILLFSCIGLERVIGDVSHLFDYGDDSVYRTRPP